MKNGDQPINPIWDNQDGEFTGTGLTKREYFAAMAMQGLLASRVSIDIDKERPFQTRAQTCIMIADELLKQLEQPK